MFEINLGFSTLWINQINPDLTQIVSTSTMLRHGCSHDVLNQTTYQNNTLITFNVSELAVVTTFCAILVLIGFISNLLVIVPISTGEGYVEAVTN